MRFGAGAPLPPSKPPSLGVVAPRAKRKKPGFELGVYRPPSEATSLMVRMTRGCHWNRCTYCKMCVAAPLVPGRPRHTRHRYRDVDFALRHVDDVLEDVRAMGEIYAVLERSNYAPEAMQHLLGRGFEEHHIQSVGALMQLEGGLTSAFLQDADAMFANAADIATVVRAVRATFPTITRVTTYARSDSINEKSAADLEAIREAGLDRLHVGLETGSLAVTKLCRKGVLPKHQLDAVPPFRRPFFFSVPPGDARPRRARRRCARASSTRST